MAKITKLLAQTETSERMAVMGSRSMSNEHGDTNRIRLVTATKQAFTCYQETDQPVPAVGTIVDTIVTTKPDGKVFVEIVPSVEDFFTV